MLNVFYVVNLGLIIICYQFMFMLIFKILPNSTISWKNAFIGALVTSILFLIGNFIIGFYLGHSKIGATLRHNGFYRNFDAYGFIILLSFYISAPVIRPPWQMRGDIRFADVNGSIM